MRQKYFVDVVVVECGMDDDDDVDVVVVDEDDKTRHLRPQALLRWWPIASLSSTDFVRAADLPLLSQIILLLSPNNFERASEARTEAFLRGQVCQPASSSKCKKSSYKYPRSYSWAMNQFPSFWLVSCYMYDIVIGRMWFCVHNLEMMLGTGMCSQRNNHLEASANESVR